MTSLPGMLLVAASLPVPARGAHARAAHRSPTQHPEIYSPRCAVAKAAHEPDRRVLALVFVVGTPLLMVKAELQPDQAAGDDARDRSGHRYVTLERDQRRGSPTYVPGETDSRIFAAEWAELLALAAMSRL